MKTFLLVATPIGNLSDITFRAIETLRTVDLVLAEDTRKAKILFQKYEIPHKNLQSFHAKDTAAKAEKIFQNFQGTSIAYISDAGTPGISDPGFLLAQAAKKYEFSISPIPGASALSAFLSVCSLPVHEFVFHGFLPHKKGRQTLIKSLQTEKKTAVFFESVHRFPRLLDELISSLEPERTVSVGREITKLYEQIFIGTVANLRENFPPEKIRGEFVVGIGPVGFRPKS